MEQDTSTRLPAPGRACLGQQLWSQALAAVEKNKAGRLTQSMCPTCSCSRRGVGATVASQLQAAGQDGSSWAHQQAAGRQVRSVGDKELQRGVL